MMPLTQNSHNHNTESHKIQPQSQNKNQQFDLVSSLLFQKKQTVTAQKSQLSDKSSQNQSQQIYTLTQQLKCKQRQITIFKQKLMDSLESNSNYHENIRQITDSLQGLNLKIKQMFLGDQKIQQMQQNTNQTISMDYVNELLDYMEKSIDKAAIKVKQQKQRMHPTVKQLNDQLKDLHNKNKQLLSFIDQRKKYSQKLKLRIKQYKSQIEQLTKRSTQNQMYINQLQNWQINLDLKFRRRDELINMIKLLIFKLRKLEKDKGVQPANLEQLKTIGKQSKNSSKTDQPTSLKRIQIQSSGKKQLGIKKLMSLSTSANVSPQFQKLNQ